MSTSDGVSITDDGRAELSEERKQRWGPFFSSVGVRKEGGKKRSAVR